MEQVFNYRNDELWAEDVRLADVAAKFGTPVYVYSRRHIETQWRAYDEALREWPHQVCYAVKANSNLGVLGVLAELGSGFDIVSVGELERVLRAGGRADRIVFSGVGKRDDEIRRALEAGIACFNVESVAELDRLDEIARSMNRRAPVSLRVNPDVDAQTHPYIATGLKENKFGIDIAQAESIYSAAAELKGLELIGVDCHIGSQLTRTAPFEAALDRVLALIERLKSNGIVLTHLNLGGGLGIRYRDESPPTPREYAAALAPRLKGLDLHLMIEPGRSIVGNAGLLLTRVEYMKPTAHKNFVIVDAAMNDLVRPALYNAWQDIVPVTRRTDLAPAMADVVGPVCETGDFLGKDRELAVAQGDLLAVLSAGAYGFSMSSNYNSRPRAAEVMVDGATAYLVRRREQVDELFAHEFTVSRAPK